MHRSASRLTRVLACAAVPVILTVAGCSSDSDKGSGSGSKSDKKSGSSSSSAKPNAKPSAALEKVAYATLPEPCKALSGKSIDSLVPEAKDKSGTATKSNDLSSRASCSWNGLDVDGLKGSKYRWLSVSLVRYESHASLGSGNKRAEDQYKKQVETAKAAEGATDVKVEPAGVGDEGTSVVYGVKKDVQFFNTTIVARTQNVVVTVDYNGASYEGADAPDLAKLLEGAVAAAKETVVSVDAAGKGEAGQGESPKPEGSSKPEESPKPEQSPSQQ